MSQQISRMEQAFNDLVVERGSSARGDKSDRTGVKAPKLRKSDSRHALGGQQSMNGSSSLASLKHKSGRDSARAGSHAQGGKLTASTSFKKIS